jgi:hypothetical protein
MSVMMDSTPRYLRLPSSRLWGFSERAAPASRYDAKSCSRFVAYKPTGLAPSTPSAPKVIVVHDRGVVAVKTHNFIQGRGRAAVTEPLASSSLVSRVAS